MFRRLPSLRWVAVDCPLSQLHRYYSDAKTSSAPSRPRFVSFAGAVPRLPHRFAPSRPTMPVPQGQDVCWWRTPMYRRSCPWRAEDLPSSRTDPLANPLMLQRPRTDRTELALSLRPTWPRLRERPWLSRLCFRGSITWLDGLLSTLQSAEALPTRCKTRFRLRGYALSGGFRTHRACYEKFQLCVSSHRILLSRTYLAQSRYILLLPCLAFGPAPVLHGPLYADAFHRVRAPAAPPYGRSRCR